MHCYEWERMGNHNLTCTFPTTVRIDGTGQKWWRHINRSRHAPEKDFKKSARTPCDLPDSSTPAPAMAFIDHWLSLEEQRSTPWMHFESLVHSLDPHDQTVTVEGHPRPIRAMVVGHKDWAVFLPVRMLSQVTAYRILQGIWSSAHLS